MLHRWAMIVLLLPPAMWASSPASYRKEAEPFLAKYCFDCHGDGGDQGEVNLEPEDLEAHLKDLALWERVWHNLRSQLMPPAEKKQPLPAEGEALARWIEREIFRLDPENLDPGRVTIRRLNRVEYQHSIEDLLGYRFDVEDHFPPDDSGYGFDNIGDALSLSPLVTEKFLEAAQLIVERAVPTEGRVPQRRAWGSEFKDEKNAKITARNLPFTQERTVSVKRWADHPGRYRFQVFFRTTGSEEATENRAELGLALNGRVLREEGIGWDTRREISFSGEADLEKGHVVMELSLRPGNPPEEGEKPLVAVVDRVEVTGPLDGSVLEYPEAYQRIFVEGPPPGSEEVAGRETYARRILERVASRAYRRPVDAATLDWLVRIAQITDAQPDHGFEHGIRQALVAVLASPSFLFRAESQPAPDDAAKVVELDEFALASRLSYFLWSSLPDEELFEKAKTGTLRLELGAQLERMLRDAKAGRFSRNFVGQWLSTRDVPTINVNADRVLGTRGGEVARLFTRDLRERMREETEMLFRHVLLEGRPAEELLTAEYTFLNDKLANYYGVPGVEGSEMRLVDLSAESRRGGILRQASFHIVTSNPTRTSPVKRGLFVLENLLGTPAPPAPPDVPALEEARKAAQGKTPTMREMMELHSQAALCRGCHARMDPIGLALENYNAIGLWREEEQGRPLETEGKLITGETFASVDELARILVTQRRKDFHRCLAEKLLTYALGRGVEYYDGPAIDEIVRRMEAKGGSLREALVAVVESVPFQKRRGDG